MGKKVNAKEKRLAEQNKRKEITIKNNASREEALQREREKQRNAEFERKRREKEEHLQKIADKMIKENPSAGISLKSHAKIAGVKSAFTLDQDTMLMTSFGNGNKAIPEQYVNAGMVKPLSNPENYRAQLTNADRDFHIRALRKRTGIEALIPNPLLESDRVDQIHLRAPLEKAVFGNTFEDNIHIQLAYNILDIDKILAYHINNIIYTINNLLRTDDSKELFDIVADLSFASSLAVSKPGNTDKQKHFRALIMSPALGYFGNVLWNNQVLKDTREEEKGNPNLPAILEGKREAMEKSALIRLAILGEIRQSNAHGSLRTWTGIYCLDSQHDQRMHQKAGVQGGWQEKLDTRNNARAELDKLYSDRVHQVNEGFQNKAKTDLCLLFRALGMRTPSERIQLACEYYDFIVKKSYKNLGFSIKKIREQLVLTSTDQKGTPYNDKDYNSVRHKMNHLLDFMIFRYYIKNEDLLNDLVEMLRISTNEAMKDAIYQDEAQKVKSAIGETIDREIMSLMNGEKLQKIHDTGIVDIDTVQLAKVLLPEKASYFSEAVYLMTRFLDGKEINDLVTTLINKFDNIASLIDVLNSPSVNMPPTFTQEFSLFADSKTIVDELRAINSFARMSEHNPNVRGTMFEEAATILGYRMQDDELKEYINNMLNSKVGAQAGQKNKGFRNFIANNVIKSDRFRYLVRYANPKKIRQLATNEMVIRFVLNDIPDAQILRYYNSCMDSKETECNEKMRTALCRIITGMSFEDYENVKQSVDDKSPQEEINDKIRKQTIIRLYLTVMYLLVKNLVYVNSRYFLAFHCAERDALLFDYEKYKDQVINNTGNDYIAFAKDHLQRYPHLSRLSRRLKEQNAPRRPSKVQKELLLDLQNSDVWACRVFRNKTEHLAAVRNAAAYIADLKQIDSYFSLFHYLMQRTIMDQYDHENGNIGSRSKTVLISPEIINPSMLRYFGSVNQYHTYCKDFVKALCIPFAYNYPRFKNLTIDGLFDRNRPGEPDKA